MKFEIKHRSSGAVLYAGEADELRQLVVQAVSSDANLVGANLVGAYLGGANLVVANLRGANLRGADLSGANLHGANLSGANLSGANLHGANLHGANLFSANLGGADLRGANLRGADLSVADLRDADLRVANLHGADLSGADLHGANLRDADLHGANLRDADLHVAQGILPELSTPLLMLLDQPEESDLIAYKLVKGNNEGIFNGGLIYADGATLEVKEASTNVSNQCAAGINVATLDWCLKNWKSGYRVKTVLFRRDDIAAIPTATDGKFRLHRCKVIGEKDISGLTANLQPVEKE